MFLKIFTYLKADLRHMQSMDVREHDRKSFVLSTTSLSKWANGQAWAWLSWDPGSPSGSPEEWQDPEYLGCFFAAFLTTLAGNSMGS